MVERQSSAAELRISPRVVRKFTTAIDAGILPITHMFFQDRLKQIKLKFLPSQSTDPLKHGDYCSDVISVHRHLEKADRDAVLGHELLHATSESGRSDVHKWSRRAVEIAWWPDDAVVGHLTEEVMSGGRYTYRLDDDVFTTQGEACGNLRLSRHLLYSMCERGKRMIPLERWVDVLFEHCDPYLDYSSLHASERLHSLLQKSFGEDDIIGFLRKEIRAKGMRRTLADFLKTHK